MAKKSKLTPEEKALIGQAASQLDPYPRVNSTGDGFITIKYWTFGSALLQKGITKHKDGSPVHPRDKICYRAPEMVVPYPILEKAYIRKGNEGLREAMEIYSQNRQLSLDLLSKNGGQQLIATQE